MITTDVGGGKNLSQTWLEYLEDELEDFEQGSVDEEATIIIRTILAANTTDEATEKEAALQLDKYAKDVHLRCDLMETMVNAARLISYDSDLQERLIHLLLGILEAETAANYRDNLRRNLERAWNSCFPATISYVDNQASRKVLRQRCEEWLSFSAFKARTLAAGICADYDDWSYKAPSIDIPIGLNPRDDVRWGDVYIDNTLMVAAQYILIAGEAIKSQFNDPDKSEEGWNKARWRLWAEQFQGASSWDRVEARTKEAAQQAHDKMVSLWPELFHDFKVQAVNGVEDTQTEILGVNASL